jgi:uncharacterized protein YkwD
MFITKSLRVTLLVALFTLTVGTFNIEHAEAKAAKVEVAPYTETQIVAATNIARATKGLPALTLNAALTAAAQKKANDMVAHGYFAHSSPTGVTPWSFIDAAGYEYIEAGENLGSGFKTADGLMKGWMNSPTHKANIMGTQYEEIGVASVKAVRNGKSVWYTVQMFGAQ